MNRRNFAKVAAFSLLGFFGLGAVSSLTSCVVRPLAPGGAVVVPVGGRGRRRRIRRRVRRRMRRRMVGARIIYVIPKQTVVGDEIELDDGSVGVVNKISGTSIEVETNGAVKAMDVEFE